ncbi:Metallo-dependent hydrolase [Collybia nuda]|uniref:Guanine deaminase n=1 Tax=Collybia nuda TaxID=64659 RepID=A0A9P5YIP1_9AGAR|nr:Metallo-dependent hydrolase [Collybia nuda]
MSSSPTIYYGPVFNPETLTSYKALPSCLFSVGPSGNIDWIVDDVAEHMLQETLAQKGCIDVNVTTLKTGEFFVPGFIDTHTHASQFPNLGSGQQYELPDWLNHVTFPTESKFSDLDFARRTYESVVRRVIDGGTTTCCYYATLHLEATKILVDIVQANGKSQRAFVGKCNMNRESPDYYRECSVEASVTDTKQLITYIRSLHAATNSNSSYPLVQPILTPRFAISCTPELLTSLGELAVQDPALHIQTHISENKSEIAYTKTLFPQAPHYAGVYDSFGLLRSNTVLAHAVHLEAPEIELIAQRGAGISHCPTSNFNLSSGVAPIGVYLDRGIKVGLGTDVSGGFSPSILNCVQNASIASKIVAMQCQHKNNVEKPQFAGRQLSVATLFYLATLGGAQVCDMDKQVGSFAPGKSFDALLVNLRNDAGNPGIWSLESDADVRGTGVLDGLLERFLFCGDDRNISRVYVQGRFVGGKSFRA